MNVKIYTDGSCRGNGQKENAGAWGFLVLRDDKVVAKMAVGEYNTTNQRMELKAAASACEYIENFVTKEDSIQIISDSAYLINCINDKWYERWTSNGWTTSQKKPVINQDLWERLIPFFRKTNFSFKKCKGHAGEQYNEIVDGMVQSVTEAMLK
jgi:ribonuclease HI